MIHPKVSAFVESRKADINTLVDNLPANQQEAAVVMGQIITLGLMKVQIELPETTLATAIAVLRTVAAGLEEAQKLNADIPLNELVSSFEESNAKQKIEADLFRLAMRQKPAAA